MIVQGAAAEEMVDNHRMAQRKEQDGEQQYEQEAQAKRPI